MSKTKYRHLFFVLCFAIMLTILFVKMPVVHATTLDSMDGSQTESNSTKSDDGSALSNYMRDYTPISSDSMDKASKYASPIVTALGTLAGVIMLVVIASIGVVTALDLLYIYVPITRNALGGGAGGANPQTPMVGGMGMGGRYGMSGGMGMGGMAGGASPQPAGHRWVSDEAIQAVALVSAGTQQPMAGGMGMGMQQPQAQQKGKSVALTYFKSRVFALILFGVCSVVLFSSVLTNCGINVGLLVLKIIEKLGSSATQVNF
jgi:hypothetical protein